MISVTEFLGVEFVGAAVLALWVAVRFPRIGPKSLRSAMAFAAAGFVVMQLASFGVGLLVRLPYGTYAALFGCALPSFFLVFLAAAWLMRLLAGSLGGSGGPDSGHRVPAHSRG